MNDNTTSKGPFSKPEPDNLGKDLGPPSKLSKQAREDLVLKEVMRSRRLDMVRKRIPSKLSQFERAYSGRSMRAAINANCLDCVGYEQAEVKRCQIYDCPFWDYRPYRIKEGLSR